MLLTVLVMIKTVDLGHLQKYRAHIERMAELYGPKPSLVISQTDARCRLEYIRRSKRTLKSEQYDDKRPWNMVWARSVTDEAFWREEANEP